MNHNSVIAPDTNKIIEFIYRWFNQIYSGIVNRYKAHSKVVAKKRKTVKGTHDASTRIKVQLDHKTTMIVHSMQAFKMWKKRYPFAKVIV